MAHAHDDESKAGLSDLAIWSIGAVALMITVIALDSIFYFVLHTPHTFHRPWELSLPGPLPGCLAGLVSFAVSYKSRRAGLAKALLFILLIALVAYVISAAYGMYLYGKNFAFFFYDPAGHGIVPNLWVLHHITFKSLSYAPPILVGAFTGWLLRRMRDQPAP